MAPRPLLLSAPNFSEGRRDETVAAIGRSFAPARVLDLHTDADHGRSVVTLAAPHGDLADALVAGAREVLDRIDLRAHEGVHPHVGALDVVPIVYLDDERRGVACAEALTTAGLLGDELDLPVFLYGQLATGPDRRERAALRAGGLGGLRGRVEAGELEPDYGPRHLDPARGATLVTARPPLVAFNVELDSDDVELARRVAAELRESGGGAPGVRALGLPLAGRGRAQVSFNVEDPVGTPLAQLVAAVRRMAPVTEAELVGLAPRAALDGFPGDVPLRASHPCTIEDALRSTEMPTTAS